ncbi:hypothetical protein BCV69DRAFT_283181 [Microstroma glucosiphilum]|uniref:Uncharacterized protein n=1 Tax=Pseudomicrostroma glucosiphilum TaxID=1684307 RepID=A0A316UBB3_9BASI|nr:hypothetical protein BCV69DRAFT_283181 [Pseudomicrostroma glucosiphilum]PWN20305.1 hypothetical protein BCV69DRAFT_283181 [Pseudomicrostroma glucosiphilum]
MDAPQRTFSMRGPPVDAPCDTPFTPELWLSRKPGEAPTPISQLRDDPLLGYPIIIQDDVEYTSTKTIPRTSSRGAVASLNILASGVEDSTGGETMLVRSLSLLDKFGKILDPYLSNFPEKAGIAREKLVLPNAASRICVHSDMSETAFNSQYSDITLYLVQCLLELGQEAIRWQEQGVKKQMKEYGMEYEALLPTSPDETVRIIPSRHLQDSLPSWSFPAGTLDQSTTVGYSDFYVVCGKQVIASIEARPGWGPEEIGVLVRDRLDPFVLQDEADTTTHTSDETLLEIASHSAATGLSVGLLMADWGRILLPYEVPRQPYQGNESATSPEGSKARIIFSSTPSFYDVLVGPKALDTANREVCGGLQDSNSKNLHFMSLSNAVFYMLAWVLQAVEKARGQEEDFVQEPARAGGERLNSAEDRGAGPSSKRGPPDSDTSDRLAQKPRGGHRSASGPVAPRASQKKSSGGGDSGGKGEGKETLHGDDYEALVQESRPLTTYISSYTPIGDGTYATVHLCLFKKSILDSSLGDDHQSKHLGGKSMLQVLPYARLDELEALLKVQRVPLAEEDRGSKIDWRLEEPDGPPLSEEDRFDIQRRTVRELRVYLQCQELQGLIIPKLYGVVSPRNYPPSTAHKLMLQCIYGGPIRNVPRKMYLLWREELVASAVQALSMLHSRSVWHGDISTSNIMVEWRKYDASALGSSRHERVEPEQVLEALQKAQDNMGISEADFKTQLDKLRAADADAVKYFGIMPTPTLSPFDVLKITIRPHVWLIDFADSEIVNAEAEEGKQTLSSELEKMEKVFARLDARYQ